jgi:hypothetical protein
MDVVQPTDVALDASDSGTVDAAADTLAMDTVATDTMMPSDVPTAPDASTAAALCMSTGGTITVLQCCSSAGDFPNSCALGACSCAPMYSHAVNACNCGSGQCFDPAAGCM